MLCGITQAPSDALQMQCSTTIWRYVYVLSYNTFSDCVICSATCPTQCMHSMLCGIKQALSDITYQIQCLRLYNGKSNTYLHTLCMRSMLYGITQALSDVEHQIQCLTTIQVYIYAINNTHYQIMWCVVHPVHTMFAPKVMLNAQAQSDVKHQIQCSTTFQWTDTSVEGMCLRTCNDHRYSIPSREMVTMQ
jgi:hypothetical protein